MNFAAVEHRTSDSMCYALDKDTIFIKIKTAYDVKSVFIHHGDPFDGGILGGNWKWKGIKEELTETYELEHKKVWCIKLKPKYKRLKYYFEIVTNDEIYYYFEDGFMTEDDINKSIKSLQCFTMPWNNEVDILKTPKWVKDTVWYQIFPDRFNNVGNDSKHLTKWNSKKPSNEDVYGGNLKGIIEKLDYIKDLGFSGIYLNPIFKALATHKYDTTNYYEIDEMFGTKEDFKNFVSECHKKDIKVMLDGVFNHTGIAFPYWQDVVKYGESSKYYNWFMLNTWPIDETKDHTRDAEFYSFAFTSRMPKLNTSNLEVINYICDICEYWIKEYDIDAWRLDVANEISHKLCKEIRERTKKLKEDIYILGEIWHDSINWLRGDEFDSVMNYPLTSAINEFWFKEDMTKKEFEHQINRCYDLYYIETNEVLFNLLDSHDTDRLFHRVQKNMDVFLQQLTILFTMPGSVSIYYGTELALDGGHDPLCRECMPWNDVDSGKYDFTIEKLKSLITLRNKNISTKSSNYKFTNDFSNSRVVEYVKNDSIKIIINASKEDLLVEVSENCILFTNKFNNDVLHSGGVLIYAL